MFNWLTEGLDRAQKTAYFFDFLAVKETNNGSRIS